MSDSLAPVLVTAVGIAAAAFFIYAAYWAFAFRRALVGHVYRNQALWLGVLSIILATVFIVPSLSTGGPVIIALSNLPVVALILGFFAFVDSTVPIARRSDPRLRDILHWEKVRFVAWGLLILVEVAGLYFAVTNTPGTQGFDAGFGGLLLFLFGAPPMLVGGRRSMDPTLRGSLKWFGLALVCFIGILLVGILESAVNIATSPYSSIPYDAVAVLAGLALYRSARSLAPINRLQVVEPETTGVPSVVEPPPPNTAP
jgi:hypothetical protein